MLIQETEFFSRRVQRLLDPESYRLLQLRLAADPEAGSLVSGTGGLRKILMLMIFAKNEQSDLSPEQMAILRPIVEEEYR